MAEGVLVTRRYVRSLVHPTPLFFGGREDVPEGGPEAERPVAHGQHGAGQAPLAQAAQQGRPGLLRLPVAVGQGDQLLGAVGADADDDQAAQPVLLQADVEVHPVYPPVHVVGARQVPAGPALVLVLPGLGEPGDRRGRQARPRAEELAQGGGEVARWTGPAGTARAGPR